MRLLLDTHILLWWVTNDRRLRRDLKEIIARDTSDVAVSAATLWEISIKRALGRIDIDLAELIEAARADSFVELAVTFRHAAAVASLPRLHDDPFDRMLIVQSMLDERQLVTADRRILQYDSVARFATLPV